MSAIDYAHLVQIYRKHKNGLDLVHQSVEQDYGYYCGSAKTAEGKAREHATAVALERLESKRAASGKYHVIVYRVPDEYTPHPDRVPKDRRRRLIHLDITWSPTTEQVPHDRQKYS